MDIVIALSGPQIDGKDALFGEIEREAGNRVGIRAYERNAADAVQERPDAAVCLAEAGALERDLYPALEWMKLRIPVVIALTGKGESARKTGVVDPVKLEAALGVPVLVVDKSLNTAADELLEAAVLAAGSKQKLREEEFFDDLADLIDAIADVLGSADSAENRRMAVRLMEKDGKTAEQVPADKRWAVDEFVRIAEKMAGGDVKSKIAELCCRYMETVIKSCTGNRRYTAR